MSDTGETTEGPQQPADTQLDPSAFGPETIDGKRPPGTEEQAPSGDPDPGDPDLEVGPDEGPSS